MDFELLKTLCRKKGVSGDEKEISLFIREIMEPLCNRIEIKENNTVVCFKKGKGNKTLAFDAHTDTVGLIVKRKYENGFLGFDTVGGIDSRNLPALEVKIGETKGIVTSKPPHLMKPEDKNKAVKVSDMFIDTGDFSEGIKTGDTVVYDSELVRLNGFVSGAYLDDRSCVYAIYELFKALKGKECDINLLAVFSSGEEMGFKGANSLDISPDALIALDVTFGQTKHEKGDMAFPLSKGCAVGTGPNINPVIYKKITGILNSRNINYQIEVLEDSSGTNAWSYQVKGSSIPTGLISVPIRYMHTPNELMCIEDLDSLCEILVMIAENFKEGDFPSLREI